jgi:hypothetical protein
MSHHGTAYGDAEPCLVVTVTGRFAAAAAVFRPRRAGYEIPLSRVAEQL